MKILFYTGMTFFLALIATAAGAETKTDLARDVYVENSETNLFLTVVAVPPVKQVLTFKLDSHVDGEHTLLCFVDGKVWSQQKFNLPGDFKLNASGLAKGQHRLTLQVIDSSARVGSVTQTIQVE